MNDTTTLVTLSRDARLMRGVSDAAEMTGRFSEMKECDSIDALTSALAQNGNPAVVVDVDDRPLETLSELEPLLEQFPGTRVIVIAAEQRQEWMIRAMQAGARHFLARNAIDTDLPEVLERLVPKEPVVPRSDSRAVVTVMSAGGGCGATTVAVNLADELQRLSKGPSLVVDLDCAWGGVAGYLDVAARYGIADVLEDARRIDPELIRSTAAPYNDHLHVLASPAAIPLQESVTLSYDQLGRTLRRARQAYEYTIVDAPRLPAETALDLARSSDLAIMVLELNIEDIRIARRRLKMLFDRGVASSRMMPLVNRYRRRTASVPWSEVKRALDFVRIGRLSNDYKHVASGINYGKPLAEAAPRSRVRRDIQRLAKGIYHAANNGGNFDKVL